MKEFKKRPTPKELVAVIGELQNLIGQARAGYDNDVQGWRMEHEDVEDFTPVDDQPISHAWNKRHATDRATAVQTPLEDAFQLCVHARAWFPTTW